MSSGLQEILDRVTKGELLVLVNEEYGYQCFFWFPTLKDNDDLVAWWTHDIETVVPLYYDSNKLGGRLILAEESILLSVWNELTDNDKSIPYLFLAFDDDSYLNISSVKYYHRGYYVV